MGTSDLAVGGRKFSGNSLRLKRDHLVYHGTLCTTSRSSWPRRVCGCPPGSRTIARTLARVVLMNLPLAADEIRSALVNAWEAEEPLGDWPREATARLAAEKYGRREWNEGR